MVGSRHQERGWDSCFCQGLFSFSSSHQEHSSAPVDRGPQQSVEPTEIHVLTQEQWIIPPHSSWTTLSVFAVG